MPNDRFEWDNGKARINVFAHKITFEIACLVFDDVNAVEERDDDPDEDRFNITGMVRGRLVTVTYTERPPRTRIISARKANQREQNKYIRQV
ncbi:MAG: BrnT family toxin [Hyphomicrobium sp.]